MKKTALITLIVIAAGLSTTSRAADAQETWEKTCVKCHGADGKGETKLGKKAGVKDFTDAKIQESFDDAKATKAIKEGVKDGEKVLMKPVEDASDDVIKELVKKVRSFKK